MLESRVLLSGTAQASGHPTPILTIPSLPLKLEPLVVHSAQVSLRTPPAATSYRISSPGGTSGLASAAWGYGGPQITITRTFIEADRTTGIMVLSEPSSGDLGEGAVTPIIVMASPLDMPSFQQQGSAVGSSRAAAVGTSYGTYPGSQPSGWSGESAAPGPPVDEQATIPDANHVDVQGSISQSDSSMILHIPVGPATHQLGVSVHTDLNTSPEAGAVLTGFSLVDGDGVTLAHVDPLWNPQTGGLADSMTVSLNGAPAGGSLVVQISTPTGGSPATSSAAMTAILAPGGSIPFVTDVQRLESVAAGSPAGLGSSVDAITGAGQSGIGTLNWTASGPGDQAGATTTAADAESLGAESGFSSQQGAPVAAGDEFLAGAAQSPEYDGRIATGPLASRSAAPLGPNLLTLSLDPTPTVDRHERGLSQAIDGRDFEADQATESSSPRPGRFDEALVRTGERVGSDDFDREEATHVAVAGLGALPLMVPARGSGGRGPGLDALLAALPGSPLQEDLPAVVIGDAHGTEDLRHILVNPRSSEDDGRPTPDFLTTACVLALGMGLTTGPIIPDLLRLIPSRPSRWLIVPAGAARSFMASKSRYRAFGKRLQRPAGDADGVLGPEASGPTTWLPSGRPG